VVESPLPKLLTVIVELVDVAVNLYQTPYVVVDVAPPQEPVGAALDAPFKVGCVPGCTQVVDTVRLVAVAQVAWLHTSDGAIQNERTAITLRVTLVLMKQDF
jgi:hypothetical protein